MSRTDVLLIINIVLQLGVILSIAIKPITNRLEIDWLAEIHKPYRKYGFTLFLYEQPINNYVGCNNGTGIFTFYFNPWLARKQKDIKQ